MHCINIFIYFLCVLFLTLLYEIVEIIFEYEPCSLFTSSLSHFSDTNNLVNDLFNNSNVIGSLIISRTAILGLKDLPPTPWILSSNRDITCKTQIWICKTSYYAFTLKEMLKVGNWAWEQIYILSEVLPVCYRAWLFIELCSRKEPLFDIKPAFFASWTLDDDSILYW